MKTVHELGRISVCVVLGAGWLFGASPEGKSLPRTVLTNEGIVVLAQAGYGERFIGDLIKQRAIRFDTTVDGLAFLAAQGISENLVRKMIAAERAAEGEAEAGKTAVVVPVRVVEGVKAGPKPAVAKDVWYLVSAPAAAGQGESEKPVPGYFAYRLE